MRTPVRIPILTLLLVSVAAAQTLNPRETITVGADVTLGMSEDVAETRLFSLN